MQTQWRMLLALEAVSLSHADFMMPAGNWTHSTNLFSLLHFVPGYNEAGEWDLITGGNWTPTNHTDVNLIGDAAIYVCPCPEPPCEPDEGPQKSGFNSSVFGCVDTDTGNVTHAVCTVFHAERTNVTCVTPSHAVSCDIPSYDADAPLFRWWQNEETPSRSYFSVNVTAISCIVRTDHADYPLQEELRFFSDSSVLAQAISVERCEVQCRAVCETVCITEQRSVHELLPQLDDWRFDPTVDNNPRDYVLNGTLWQERSPAQYMVGAVPRTYGRELLASNMTCTMPTLTAEKHTAIFGGLPGNLSSTAGLFDMYGRRLNAMNVFDLSLYVALHAFRPLERLQCVTPFTNATNLDPLPGEDESYFHSLVCHQPHFEPYNVSLGSAPVQATGRRLGQGQGQGAGGAEDESMPGAKHEQSAQRMPSLDKDPILGRAEASQDWGTAKASRVGGEPSARGETRAMALDDWDEWHGGSDWDWEHAAAMRDARNASAWERRWRAARRAAPRRRLLYHEFEIARSPWDFWLAESEEEQHARLVRRHAQLTGDCTFYHNCTDPLPPPLLLHEFACWLPNRTVQPNVTTVPPRSILAHRGHHPTNENTTYREEAVWCLQPSWPNSTSISCLTPSTAITCPYTDSYRGNVTELRATGEAYFNETQTRCTAWPLLDVYRHAANSGWLFPVPPNLSHGYRDPWEQPWDSYAYLTAGVHHYCAIDDSATLRCIGHNVDGRASLDWPDTPNASELTQAAVEAIDVATARSIALGETPEERVARRELAISSNPPARTLDTCAGAKHTCAVEQAYDSLSGNYTGNVLKCWGSNYSSLDVRATNLQIARMPIRGEVQRVMCGLRFVCALQDVPPAIRSSDPLGGLYPFCTGLVESRQGAEDEALPSPFWPTVSGTDQSLGRFSDFSVGANHACGIRNNQLVCYGNYAPIPQQLPQSTILQLRIGGEHTCVNILEDDAIRCFSGSATRGPRDASWLEELLSRPGGTWSALAGIAIADSVACVLGHDGQAYCGGEPGQVHLSLMHPPVKLQPERIDLIERGVSFTEIACGGVAARNNSLVQLGEQYCCGLTLARLPHCWGVLPPHRGMHLPTEETNPQGTRVVLVPLGTWTPLNESNASVYHIRARRRIQRARYLRDFGLRVLLDTQPAVSAADATTNFSSPYLCNDVPRRATANISDWLALWLRQNVSNASSPLASIRSWHLAMLLSLQVASYTDDLSCFGFTQPFPRLHCAPLLPYVNRTVAVSLAPPKPFVIERISATDLYTTKYTLAHTVQRDGYCFEKLRLTPSEQFQRGAAWHRATQRVVDGFEVLFSFQFNNAARLCKTVRALTTNVLLYERCTNTGSDGIALLIRGGGPPTALGGGGHLGYAGLNRTLAIEFDSWHNAELGEPHYSHVSVQTGGPRDPVGAHKEHYLSTSILDPIAYPEGFADGKAHIARVVYTPGFDADKLQYGPSAHTNHIKYWVAKGAVAEGTFPHEEGIGSWSRPGVGILQVYLDNMSVPVLALPIDIGYTLGIDDGRAWLGLSAATGRRFQNHYVLSWQACEGPRGCATPMNYCETFGCNPTHPSARYRLPTHQPEARYRDLTRGVAARPIVRRGFETFDENAVGDAAAGSNTLPGGGPDLITEVADDTWGDEPEGWTTPVAPYESADLWGPGGGRFTIPADEERYVDPDDQRTGAQADGDGDNAAAFHAVARAVDQPFLGALPGSQRYG